jgi:membrane protease YdiL (CAAX protease family)
VTARQLWIRLATLACTAGALLLTAGRPALPIDRWPVSDALLLGLVAGTLLYRYLAMPALPLSLAAGTVILLAAGAEEVVWRWFALGGLAPRLGPIGALAVTSIGFGLVHPAGRAQHILTGATFGAVYLASGSVVASWCAHATYNLALAARLGEKRARGDPT